MRELRKVRGTDYARNQVGFPNKNAAQRRQTLEKRKRLLLKNLLAGSLFSWLLILAGLQQPGSGWALPVGADRSWWTPACPAGWPLPL